MLYYKAGEVPGQNWSKNYFLLKKNDPDVNLMVPDLNLLLTKCESTGCVKFGQETLSEDMK